MKKFTPKSSTERFSVITDLFSLYSSKDREICKRASKAGLYLIGGTALELWCKELGVNFWRQRSDNDIDLYTPQGISLEKLLPIAEFGVWLKKGALEELVDNFVQDVTKDKPWMYQTVRGYNVMHPVWLFRSKFGRYIKTSGDRKLKDEKDLLTLLSLIEKLKFEGKLVSEMRATSYFGQFRTFIETH